MVKHITLVLITAFVVLFFVSFAVASPDSPEAIQLGLWTLLPPLVAICTALIFREVISALLLGLLVGSILMTPVHPVDAIVRIPADFLINNLADSDHASIILFSLMLGGMVGILSRSGGTAGIVAIMERFAKGRKGASFMAWLLGVAIFFDDYANTLIVGQTMRPYTDKMKISRAKLAYIVDSTAAPVASIALVSTWIGFELGLLKDASEMLGMQTDAFMLFLHALPYHFYSFFTIVFVLAIALRDRDFGPMRAYEQQALKDIDSSRVEGIEPEQLSESQFVTDSARARDAWIAVVPIVLVILATLVGLYYSGLQTAPEGSPLFVIIGEANSFQVLLASSFVGVLAGALMALIMAKKSLTDVTEGLFEGMRSMLPTMIILTLAWCLGDVCNRIGTADVIIGLASENMPVLLLPATVFLLAAIIAFATGTSWGTMAILIPIAIPLAHHFAVAEATDGIHAMHLVYGTIGAVLAGATFGDHCSPISDTTVMSSLASQCNHIAHVRSQIPYAAMSGGVAILVGYLPAGFDMPPWVGLILGMGILFFLPRFFKPNIE